MPVAPWTLSAACSPDSSSCLCWDPKTEVGAMDFYPIYSFSIMNPGPSGFGPFRNSLSVLLVVVRG